MCVYVYMGGCQNYGPFLGTLNIRCRILIGTQKGTIILTTTHMYSYIHATSGPDRAQGQELGVEELDGVGSLVTDSGVVGSLACTGASELIHLLGPY